MASLPQNSQKTITDLINAAVADKNKIPGVSVAIANKNGDILYKHSAGVVGVDSTEKVTNDSIYWLASCTKISGTIAALQAVEKGLISLDSADDLEKFCPELADIPILKEITDEGHVVLVPKENRITLRLLLTHTSGFGYPFWNKNLARYSEIFNINELAGTTKSISTPLSFEPGTSWEYGIGIDWALIAVSRAEGKSINDLLIQNVFEPAGIKDTTMRPDANIKARLTHLHQRGADGKLETIQQAMRSILNPDPYVAKQAIDSAGAGLFSRPSEYVKLLAILLNDGVAGQTGKRILSKESVAEVYKNQIPQWPDFARTTLASAQPEWAHTIPELYPQAGNPSQGWGLSWFLNEEAGPTGRKAGSGFWCGIANLFYWVDRETGVTGMLATQILPFGDMEVMTLFGQIEAVVYQNIVQ